MKLNSYNSLNIFTKRSKILISIIKKKINSIQHIRRIFVFLINFEPSFMNSFLKLKANIYIWLRLKLDKETNRLKKLRNRCKLQSSFWGDVGFIHVVNVNFRYNLQRLAIFSFFSLKMPRNVIKMFASCADIIFAARSEDIYLKFMQSI